MQLGAWLRARFTGEAREADDAAAGAGDAQVSPAALAARAAQVAGSLVSSELPSGLLWTAHPSILTADTTSEVAAARPPAPAQRAAQAPTVMPVQLPAQAPTLIAPERAPTAPAGAPTLIDPNLAAAPSTRGS